MFGLDCLNITVLALILSGYNASRGAGAYFATLSGLAVFFWTAFIASIILLVGGLLLISSTGSGNLRSLSLVSTMLVSCGYNSATGLNTLALVFITLGLLLKSGIGPFFI